ncbi:hypothetical protein OHB39_39465 [Streptomyces sp. NBC_00047]|uniref:hypothetical protein n=1 Tax=Streptomyces sp. NBC_00047 TaxID=2975627 RepID=UPI00224F59D2|nr:hypothetical protein [Streptomyces sp. NBC_00047]MCX5613521.1 hypothetical protein [Streptomyces sp. NBC_00047]
MSTISMRKNTLVAVAVAVAGTMALTGCKNGNEELSPAQPTSSAPGGAPASPSAAASPSTGGGEAPAGAAGTAKSGQAFKLGETATVPFDYGNNKGGTIDLTVTTIEQGNPADLESLNLGDKVKGMIPYYVRYTVKNVGTTDLSFSTVGHIKGLLPDGSEAQGVSVIGKFEKCKGDSLPKGFTNGQTQNGCAIALAPSVQTKVAGAQYWGKPYNNLSDGKPLTWK